MEAQRSVGETTVTTCSCSGLEPHTQSKRWHCRGPAPTVLGQVARLLAVSAWWCNKDHYWLKVTLGTSRFSPLIWSPVTVPSSIGPACVLPFVWLLVLVISRSVFKLPLVFCLPLSQSVISYPIKSVAISIPPAWSLPSMPPTL
ncbi:hypothetical protein Tco_0531918 [Tanacetum coccineum]